MKRRIEATYGKTLRGIMVAVNPVKKAILKTHCITHKYINTRSIDILKNEKHDKEYKLFIKYLVNLNEGVTWADQDFKSTNHFFHYDREKGLYGFSNAYEECRKYYNKAAAYYDAGDIGRSMFYLGAACHLVQDATVPQHVNNRLLNKHRGFELWIISKIISNYPFYILKGIKKYGTIKDFIRKNAQFANKTSLKYAIITDSEKRNLSIAKEILAEAQETTAGFLLYFYENEIEKKEY